MASWNKKLREWQGQGLVTPEQAAQIEAYETAPGGRRSFAEWALIGLLILGACAIGLGIISLVAANWHRTPDWLKLTTGFGFLIGIAAGACVAVQRGRTLWFEPLVALFMLQCMAVIGLISQIYHVEGEFYEAMMLWSLITAALMVISRNVAVISLWSIGFVIGLSCTWGESDVIRTFVGGDKDAAYAGFFAAGPLLGILLAGCGHYLGGASSGHARVFRVLAMLAVIPAWFCFEIISRSSHLANLSLNYLLPAYVLAIPVAIGISQGALRPIQKCILWAILISCLIAYSVADKITEDAYIELLPAVFAIWILALSAIFVAGLRWRRWFGFFLALIGLRFLMLYFDAFGGLVTTGLGLIITGILIVVAGVLLSRNHARIAQWAERLT